MNQPDINITQKVQELSLESLQNNDPTGWFDRLYGEANGDTTQVPWARMTAHPCLQNWLETWRGDIKIYKLDLIRDIARRPRR
ncbi:hypothetical protein [Aphanothece sacrum]|uniref:Thiopurine S-methyltransferase n=1 Tax=Aphanothece sacrum FPU1 TaxID=1920663 RepID=A0A401IFG4_APHSA|nr:hypothetical protein [Aphanothece sacrum]GBF80018.1 thiopurine S-methyltransferase [Aphanothece sacrum FPU1]GBF84560.1 thiopurine S-methyltransferase [Aphanothece sacrum FPU3]